MNSSRQKVLGTLLPGLLWANVNFAATTVESINRLDSTPTSATTVTWIVTFSGNVKGVDASNFSLSPTLSGASIVSVTGKGRLWDVAATTGSGDGTLRLNMVNDTGIHKNISNLPFNGQSYTIDKTPPTSTISGPSKSYENNGPVTYTVTYADPNFNASTLTAANVTLNKTGTANGTVSVSGAGATRTVTISSLSGNGTLSISIAAGTATDLAGNSALAVGPSPTFTVDNVAPIIAFGAPSATFANAGPVNFTVAYADAHFNASTLSAANVTLNKTGTADGTINVTGSGNSRTVTISSITGNGTLGISIAAGTASDLAGNAAPAAGPSATFTVDNLAPTITVSPPSATLTKAGPVSYTVTYADANFNASTLTSANVALNKTGTANGTVGVTGSGATRTVTISSITGNGTLAIALPGGTATDLAGNSTPAATGASFAVDNSGPTVALSAPSANFVKSGPVTYIVTYADANFSASTLAAANVALNSTGTAAGTLSVSGSGNTRTVTISSISGNGTLGLSLAAETATDLVGNVAGPAGPSATFIVDNTAPTLTIGSPSLLQTKNGPVTFNVSFSDANFSSSSLTAANVSLNTTGAAAGTVSVAGSGTSYSVTVSSINGNGSLGISIAAGTAADLAGNAAAAAGPSATVNVDNTVPTISISAPSSSITANGPVTYTVTYADPNFSASTLTAANVSLNTTGTATGTVSVTGSGNTRTVTISSVTGNGTLGISIAAGTATDLAGNLAPAAGPSATFTVDNTPPTIAISAPSSNFANGGTVTYTVTYSDANFGASTLSAAAVTLNATATAAGSVSVTGSGSTFTVTISSITGDGTLGISITAGTATDLAGNAAPAATGSAFTVDNTAPAVTIGPPSSNVVGAGPVTFAVTYADANFNASTLTPANITLTATGTANGTIALTGSGASYTVTLSSLTGNGTLGIAIASGTATDRSGNAAPAATSGTFTMDNTAPTVAISAPSSSLPNTGPVSYTITYTDANFAASTLSPGDITLNKTGTAAGTVSVAGSGNTRTVTVSGLTGNGTLSISLAAGTATDLAGNPAPAAGPSGTFTVDNLAPTITIGAPSAAFSTSGPVTYTVTYADIFLGAISLGVTDITLNTAGSATGTLSVSGSGSTRTVTISNIAGDGTLGISIAAGTATDLTGNTAAAAASAPFMVDNSPPTLSMGPPSSALTAAGPVTFLVTYADANLSAISLAAAGVTLNRTGTANGTVNVSGTGNTRTVTISGITGDGTLGIAIAAGTAADSAGNSAPVAASSTFSVDNTAPTVTIGAPSNAITKAGPVSFTVAFADANFNASTLTSGDITLNTTGTASGSLSVTGSGTTRTVNITGITGNGTLGISLAAGTANDLVANSAPAAGPSATFIVDNLAPTVTISAPSASITTAGPVTFGVTYSDANFNASALTPASISLHATETAAATVAVTGSGANYTVTLSNITGSGTLGISLAPGTATDLAGNSAPAAASAAFTVDNSTPIVTISAPSSQATKGGPVTYTVTYPSANFSASTLSPSDVTLNKTGSANGTVTVSGSGNTHSVTLASITGNGSLGISLAAGTATYLAGNLAPAAGPSQSFTVDNVAPTLTISPPSKNFANTGPVTYTVVYADALLNAVTLTASDITLNATGTATGTVSVTGGGDTYTVTISSLTGNGTLGIAIAAGTASDLAGNLADAASSSTFTTDNTAPTVTIGPPSQPFATAGPVAYTVTYGDANFNAATLTAANVTLNTTGTALGAVDVTGSGNTFTVTITSITGNGTLGISLASGTANDLAGNVAPATTSSASFAVDNLPPGVVIGAPSASFANNGPVTFTVTCADANFSASALSAAGVILNATETANGTVSVSGGGTSYTVSISNITGHGTLGIAIPAGLAADLAGNTSPAVTGPAFTVDNTAPTIALSAPSSSFVQNGSVSFTVSYADAHFNDSALAAGNVTLNATGTATGSVSVTGSGNTRTITVSGITGDGTLGISVAAGTATDLAGNLAAGATSATFTVDNTAPTVAISGPSSSFANSGSVSYTVTYWDANFGAATLTSADVTLNRTGTAAGTLEVSGNGVIYTVTVSGITGDGTMGISLPAGTATDLAGNSASGAASSNFTVDNTAPTLSIGPPSSSYANSGSVTFAVAYADVNFGASTLVETNVTLIATRTATGTIAVTGSGTNYVVTLSAIAGNGTLAISIEAGTATDLAENFAPTAASPAINIDNVVPTVTMGAPSSSITTNGPVTFPISYADAYFDASTLTATNVTLNKTGTATGIVSVSGSGNSRTVTISSIAGNGTLGISLAAGTATDLSGNAAPAAGPSSTFIVDNTAPAVSISAPSPSITAGGPVSFSVSYTDANVAASTLAETNVTLIATGTATGTKSVTGSGANWTVTVANIVGNGTLGISLAAATASDLAGNLGPSATSGTFTVDNAAPTVSISAPSSSIAAGGPVSFAVACADANLNTSILTSAIVALNKTGTADGTVSVTGSGTSYTVTLSNVTGNGTLGISLPAGIATDLAGNTSPAAASPAVNVDNSAPTVLFGAPSIPITTGGPVAFTVSYADTYLGTSTLSLADVTLNKTGTATGSVSVSGTGDNRTVTVSSISGNGSLGISLAAGTATDLAGNLAPAVGPSATFIVDNTVPAVSISAPSPTITAGGPVSFTVSYADANFNAITLTASDVLLNRTGTANGFVSASGSGNNRTVAISDVTGDGTLGVSLAAGTATDLANNLAPAAGPSATFTVDNTAPTVTISAPSSSITAHGPVTFGVTYADSNFNDTTFTASSVTLNKSGTANGTVSLTSIGNGYTVTIANLTGNGTLGIALPLGVAADSAGNPTPAVTSAICIVDNTPPTVSIGPPSASITAQGPVAYAVSIADANPGTNALTATNVLLKSTGTANGTVAVTGRGTNWTIAISNITGDGTLGISLAAGAVSDLAGNLALATTGATFTVDNTLPALSISAPSQPLTRNGPVSFAVGYSDAHFDSSTLSAANVTLQMTGTANGTLSISGSGNTRTVTISDVTGDGALGISIAGGTAADWAGNLALAAGPSATFTVDNTVPTLTIGAPSSNVAGTGPVAYTVTATEPSFAATTLTTVQVTLNRTGTANGIVSVSGTGSARTVTISGMTGNGTLSISLAPGIVADATGNLAPAAGPSAPFTVDNTPPTLAIGAPSPAFTAGGPVNVSVSYGDGNFGASTLAATDVTLIATGTATGTKSVTGGGTNRTVTISNISGNGTLGIALAPATASDLAGNLAPSATSGTFAVDNTAPTVIISPSSAPFTAGGPVSYTVSFADANLNVGTLTSANVTLNKTGTANGTVSVAGSGANYTVTISGVTGDGTLGISLPAGLATDLAGNLAPSATSGTFAVDNTAPTVIISPSSAPFTAGGPVSYTVSYADANLGQTVLTSANIALVSTGTATGNVSVSGSGNTRTVAISGITGNGTLRISLAADTATDLAGNLALAAGPSPSVTVDRTVPTVTIGSPSTTITKSGPVSYTVVCSDPGDSGFTLGPFPTNAIALNATGTASGTVNVSGSGNTRTVTIANISGDGTLGISIAAGVVTDAVGHASAPVSASGFVVDNTAPIGIIGPPSASATGAQSVSYAINYDDAKFDRSTLTAANIALNKTGTANGAVNVTGAGTTFTVTISNITGDGTLGISVAAGTAFDLAGNIALGAGPSLPVTVDNSVPTVSISAPSSSITTNGPVHYTVVFSAPNDPGFVLGPFTTNAITLNSTGTATGTLRVSGAGNTRLVSISNITGDGTLGISIAAGIAINSIGHPSTPAGPSASVLVDNTAPTVAISSPSLAVTDGQPVSFAVGYADANFEASVLTSANVQLVATGTANGTIGVSGSGAVRTVTISNISGQGSLAISIAAGTAIDLAGNLAPAAKASVSCVVNLPVPTNANDLDIPVIIAMPPPQQTVALGADATFSVTAFGEPPLSFQWRLNGVDIPGATNATLTVTNVQPANLGVYQVVVGNLAGFTISGSATLALSLQPPATVTQLPQIQTLLYEGSVALSVTALGNELSFQWQYRGVDIPGATNATLLLNDIPLADLGEYAVHIDSRSNTVSFSSALVSVDASVGVLVQPQSLAVSADASVRLAVTADGTVPLNYQWLFNGTAIPGATNATLELTHVQPADAGAYHVLIRTKIGSLLSAQADVVVDRDASTATGPITPDLRVAPVAPVELTIAPGTDGAAFIQVTGPSGRTMDLLASTNLTDWFTLTSLILTDGRANFLDPSSTTEPPRSYRVAESQSLKLLSIYRRADGAFVIEIAGPWGQRIELQATTDFHHWFALTNVVFTDRVIRYVDTSALHSPERFYRAVAASSLNVASATTQSNGAHQLVIQGTPGHRVVLQSSPDLVHWTSLETNLLTGPTLIQVDERALDGNGRFYRVVSETALAPPPTTKPDVSPSPGKQLAISRQADGSFVIQISGSPGQHFELQASADVTNWRSLTNVVLREQTFTYVDSPAAQTQQRFYRAMDASPVKLLTTSPKADGQYQLLIQGAPGQTVLIQRSSDLVAWTSISTNLLNGTLLVFADPHSRTSEVSYYRVVRAP